MPIDRAGVLERVERFTKRSIKKETKVEAARDTPFRVQQLCSKAKRPILGMSGVPLPAAVCVYPNMVAIAKEELKNEYIKVASVATAFPSGMTDLKLKIEETKYAVKQGADEIDMVLSRGKFLSGDRKFVFEEIQAIKKACGKSHLKVILETGELDTLENIRDASFLAMYAGADFIKTSTGKVQPAATLEVTLVMLHAIRDYYHAERRMVGMKAAGGISTAKQAIQYLVMVKETLGDKWLTPEYFRFGASSLANDLLMQIQKQLTGNYQSAVYFTQD